MERPEYYFSAFLSVYCNLGADTYLAILENHGAGIEQGIGCWVANGNARLIHPTVYGNLITTQTHTLQPLAIMVLVSSRVLVVEQPVPDTASVHSLKFMATLVLTHTLQSLAIMVLVSSRVLVVEQPVGMLRILLQYIPYSLWQPWCWHIPCNPWQSWCWYRAGYWLLSSQWERPEYCFCTFFTVYGNLGADTYLATPGNHGARIEQGICVE